MNKFFLFFLFAFAALFSDGQSQVEGVISDEKNVPIEFAVICLLSHPDSVIVKSTISDSKGYYLLDGVTNGRYIITCSSLGYSQQFYDSLVISDLKTEQLVKHDFIMATSAREMQTVTVSAKLPFIEVKADKIVVHPEASITSAGASVWDLLLRAPGITAGANDQINLRGKSGVEFYLDERPMYLGGEELANALKAMPAASVEAIEILANPGARYDAEGGAGIIIIRQKRSSIKGWSGSFNSAVSQGFYFRTNHSFNMSWRFNKLNFFVNGSYSKNNSYQDLTIKRNFFNGDGSFASGFRQHTLLRSGGDNFNGRIGLDYYLNDKITIGFSGGGFFSDTFSRNENQSILSNQEGSATGVVDAFNPLNRIFSNNNYNFNFNYKIDSLGQNVSLNGDYLNYSSEINQSLLNKIYSMDQGLINRTNLLSVLPSSIDIISVKSDYTLPLRADLILETGAKVSQVTTNNKADFSDEVDGVLVPNFLFSNEFSYSEAIGAFYATMTLNRPRYSFQLGLRDEVTRIEGNQKGNPIQSDSSFVRDFNNLFPTIFAMILLDSIAQHILTLNAGRRIDRPNYQDMNPFTYPLDQYTLYSGNPFLVPSFTYSCDVSYSFKNMITTSILYNFQEELITEVIKQEGNTFFSRPDNLAKQHAYGIAINASIPFKNRFSFQCYSELMNNIVLTDLNGRFLDNRGAYWYIGPMLNWSTEKLWGFEVGGNYTTRVVSGQFKTLAVAVARAGVSKRVLGGNGTFKLTCDDVFHSNRPGGDILGLGESTASWKSRFDTRVISFSFSYRFSKGAALKVRTQNAADSEKSRVK